MTLSILHVAFLSLASGAAGAAAGFLLARIRRERGPGPTALYLEQMDILTAERDALAVSEHELRSSIEEIRCESSASDEQLTELQKELEASQAQRNATREELDASQAALKESQAKLAKVNQQAIVLAKNLKTLLAERETTKSRVSSLQGMLVAVHQKTQSMQAEFDEAQTEYRRELAAADDRRKDLEEQLTAARAEQVAFQNRINQSIDEHGSAEDMIESAQLRLGQIEMLERTVEKLENEKAEVEATVRQLRKDNADLRQELSKIDELKIHNQQLVLAVEALEKSRQESQQEAEQSAQESDTLRMKLTEIENGFAEMEREQNEAIRHVRDAAAV